MKTYTVIEQTGSYVLNTYEAKPVKTFKRLGDAHRLHSKLMIKENYPSTAAGYPKYAIIGEDENSIDVLA